MKAEQTQSSGLKMGHALLYLQPRERAILNADWLTLWERLEGCLR